MPALPVRTRAPRTRFLLRTVSVSVSVLLLAGALSAQSLSRLGGRVLDPQGRPVANATVVAVGPTSVPVVDESDSSGHFEFPTLPDGRYELTASAPGLVGETRGVMLSASTPLASTVDITLRVNAVTETLVISAAQIDQPLSRTADSVTIITGDDLDARQVTSLGVALSTVPGFTVARSGGPGTLTSIFPRGGDSDFTLVLVDGIRANAFGGGIDLSQVSVADIDRIEIVRGPQSALYGADAIGGVVQVITRQGGRPTASALLETGSRDTRRMQASTTGSFGRFRWQGGGDYFEDAGFTGVAPANGERVSNDDARARQGWVGAGWGGVSGTDVQSTFRYVDTERGAPGAYGSDPAGQFFGVDRVARGVTERRGGGIRIVHPWTGPASRVRQRLDVDFARYDLSFLSAFGLSESDTRRMHARVQTDAALGEGVGVSGGVEWLAESARNSFIQAAGSIVPVERRVIGTFGEVRWNTLERVGVQAGLRAEHITRDAFVVNGFSDHAVLSVNPKLAVSWLVSRSLPAAGARAWTRVRAAAGTGIRPPDVFEIAFTDNPELKPERSRSFEIGLTQTVASGAVQFEAATFVNEYDDLIVSVGSLRDVSRYRTDNVSNALSRGLELSAAWQGPHGLNARAAYTLLDTEIRAIDHTAQAPSPYKVGEALLRRPRHSGSLAVRWSAGRTSLFTNVDARGATLDAEPAFGPSGGLFINPGRTVIDAGGAVRAMRGVEVYARVMNVLNRDFEEVLGFPSPGRTAFVGVRFAARR